MDQMKETMDQHPITCQKCIKCQSIKPTCKDSTKEYQLLNFCMEHTTTPPSSVLSTPLQLLTVTLLNRIT